MPISAMPTRGLEPVGTVESVSVTVLSSLTATAVTDALLVLSIQRIPKLPGSVTLTVSFTKGPSGVWKVRVTVEPLRTALVQCVGNQSGEVVASPPSERATAAAPAARCIAAN
ncbi:hypothetical protein D3C81_1908920 [compost metagenome]